MRDPKIGLPEKYPGEPKLFKYEKLEMYLWKKTEFPRMKVVNGNNCCRVIFGEEHRMPLHSM
jgi:hypothetical protein